MAGGGRGRPLGQTPTWAVVDICFHLVLILIHIKYFIHLIGKWLTKRNKRALYEALENMLLGLLSLLITVGQDRISDMCTSKAVEATWHPCNSKQDIKSDKGKDKSGASDDNSRRWLPSALDSSGGWPM
ncbi:hypothetical protein COP2_024269 [Malus domestica]